MSWKKFVPFFLVTSYGLLLTDSLLSLQLDIKSKALHWRALRIGSTTYLHLFSSIDSGDLGKLVDLIETERAAAEERAEALEAGVVVEGEADDKLEESTKAVELGETPDLLGQLKKEDKDSPSVGGSLAPSRVASPKLESEAEAVASMLLERAKTSEPLTPKRPRTVDVVEDDVEMEDGAKEPEAKKVKQTE